MKLKRALKFCILTLFILSLTHCTIQKRTVNKGWFVQWHFNKKFKSGKLPANEEKETASISDENQNVILDEPVLEEGTPLGDDKQSESKVIESYTAQQNSEEKNFNANLKTFTYKPKLAFKIKKSVKRMKGKLETKRGHALWAFWISLFSLVLGTVFLMYAYSKSAYLVGWALFLGTYLWIFALLGSIICLILWIDFWVYRSKGVEEKEEEVTKEKKPIYKTGLYLTLVGFLLLLFSFISTIVSSFPVLNPISFVVGLMLLILAVFFSKKHQKA